MVLAVSCAARCRTVQLMVRLEIDGFGCASPSFARRQMDENELLELNADLMVVIREKQEEGALDDAIA